VKINWRSLGAALFSALTILAALPYQLGDLSTIVPTNWKPTIVAVGLVATVILRSLNAVKQDSDKQKKNKPND